MPFIYIKKKTYIYFLYKNFSIPLKNEATFVLLPHPVFI